MLDQLLAQAQNEGWDAFDMSALKAAQEKELLAEQEAIRTQSKIVTDALANDAGQKFIGWLVGKTLHRPPGPAELSAADAQTYAIAKARREGQNQIVFMILSALAAADGDAPTDAGELSEPTPAKKPRRGKR